MSDAGALLLLVLANSDFSILSPAWPWDSTKQLLTTLCLLACPWIAWLSYTGRNAEKQRIPGLRLTSNYLRSQIQLSEGLEKGTLAGSVSSIETGRIRRMSNPFFSWSLSILWGSASKPAMLYGLIGQMLSSKSVREEPAILWLVFSLPCSNTGKTCSPQCSEPQCRHTRQSCCVASQSHAALESR